MEYETVNLLRVELTEGNDCKVYSVADGSDVSGHVGNIVLKPGRRAEAKVFRQDENGKRYYDRKADDVAHDWVPVVLIEGRWINGSTGNE